MKCFYHSADLDGHCGGAIVKRKFPECEMIGIDYGDDFPWDDIEAGEKVIMVDFSLQPFSDMVRLHKLAQLHWIDHHKTAIDEHLESGKTIEGRRDQEYAACELCWNYFFPDEPMPETVHHLGRYDIWKHTQWQYEFQMGFRLLTDTKPESAIWESLLSTKTHTESLMSGIINNGKVVVKYQTSQGERAMKRSFEYILDLRKPPARLRGLIGQLVCLAVNGEGTSDLFKSKWDADIYHAMLLFKCVGQGRWMISLYTTHNGVDCGAICKKFGGGGHRQAAGFVCKTCDLPEGLI